jgi:hypothetical protein
LPGSIAIPSAEVLQRIDGMQLGVPSSTAQITITSWKFQDIPPMVVLEPFWVHVEGVPHAVRHFHGLWAVGSLVGAPQDVDLVTLRSRGIVRIQLASFDASSFTANSDDSGQYARAVVMIRLYGYEFRFRLEAPDFVPDPMFKPHFWKKKDDDVDGDTSFDGTGKQPESSVRHVGTSVTSMDVDSAKVAGATPSGKTVTLSLEPAGNHLIAVTLYNPYPRTPRGVEIVKRAKRMSPSLIAAPDRGPKANRVPSSLLVGDGARKLLWRLLTWEQ